MPGLKPSHVAIAGLAAWLMLRVVDLPGVNGTALQPLVLGTGLQVHIGELALVAMVVLRVVRRALQGESGPRWVSWVTWAAWLAVCSATAWSLAGQLFVLQASTETPLLAIPPAWLLPSLQLTLLATGAIAWWVADRLDAIGLDGAFILLLPEFAVHVIDWHIDTMNSVFVGLVSPWRALDSPLLALAAVALLLVARQPAPDSRVLGAWGPRSALPLLLLPYVARELTSGLPDLAVSLAPWLGVLLAGAALLRSQPARRKPWWPLLAALALPLCLLTAVGTVWGSGVLERRFAGDATLVAEIVYDSSVGEADLQRIRDRLAAARMEATVVGVGDSVQVTVRDTSPQSALWWLERSGARQNRVGLHLVASTREEDTAPLTQGSTDPRTWSAPPEGLLLAHWRCPRWCRPTLVRPSILPDHPVLHAEVDFDPDRMQADVIVHLTPGALAATDALVRDHLGEQVVLLVDGRIWTQGALTDTTSEGDLRLRVGNPWRARWLADRLAGGTLDVGDPLRVDLVRVE